MTLASASCWSAEQQPIDYSTAAEDIATLQSEKKSTDDQMAKGIFGFTPIGLVPNEVDAVAHSDDQAEEKTKAYNEHLQQKIDATKAACGIE